MDMFRKCKDLAIVRSDLGKVRAQIAERISQDKNLFFKIPLQEAGDVYSIAAIAQLSISSIH